MELSQTEEAKEKLLALKTALEKIEKSKSKGVNVFEAAGLVAQEVKHSAFLAWLFDPNKPHGLGNTFLRRFCERLAAYHTSGDKVKQNSEIIGESFGSLEKMLSDRELTVVTEKVVVNKESRMDIFIASAVAKTVIVIENKVFTSMHDNQLNRYESELNSHGEYKNYNKVYVYLTPHGDLPYDDDWCVLDYGAVFDIVRELYRGLPRDKANTRLKILMEDYIKTVDTNILGGNKELRNLCKQILREHGEAIELLKNYTDNAEEVIAYCKEYLKRNYESIVIYKESKLSFEFYTRAMKEYFVRNGEDIEGVGSMAKFVRGMGQVDGPIGGAFCLNKNTEEDWSAAQRKIMAAVDSKKKQGRKYFAFGGLTVINQEEREKAFDEIKDKLDMRLEELILQIKKLDEMLDNM